MDNLPNFVFDGHGHVENTCFLDMTLTRMDRSRNVISISRSYLYVISKKTNLRGSLYYPKQTV